MGPGLSKASGLLLSSAITSNVLSSTACSAIDNGVVEEEEMLKQREDVICAMTVAGMIRDVRKKKKNRIYERSYSGRA